MIELAYIQNIPTSLKCGGKMNISYLNKGTMDSRIKKVVVLFSMVALAVGVVLFVCLFVLFIRRQRV